MLEYIYVRNFQSHRETVIEVSPGITGITGDNNSGKTSLCVRALATIAFNPRGWLKNLARHGKGKPLIEIGWNGHTIIRDTKGYTLDGEEYGAVGDKVPRDIRQVLNLDMINFKFRRDPLFLVSHAPGIRAKLISEAAGLDAQEGLLKLCNVDIGHLNTEIKVAEHLKSTLMAQVSRLTPLEKAEPITKEIDVLSDDIDTLFDAGQTLGHLVNQAKAIPDTTAAERKVAELSEKVEAALVINHEVLSLQTNMTKLGGYAHTMSANSKILEEKEPALVKLLRVCQDAEELSTTLHKLSVAMETIKRRRVALADTIESLTAHEEGLRNAIADYDELIAEMETCPLCGGHLLEDGQKLLGGTCGNHEDTATQRREGDTEADREALED